MRESFSVLWQNFIAGFWKRKITCPQELFEKEFFSGKNYEIIVFWGNWAGKNFDFWKKHFGRFVKTAFDVSIGSFWEFFWKKSLNFLSFLHTEQTLFGNQSKLLQQRCRRCFLRVQTNVLRWNTCLENLRIFFIVFGHWAKYFWLLVKLFFGRFVKTAFYVTVPTFEKNFSEFFFNFGKIWGEIIERRNFSLSILDDEQKVFGCKNCIQCVPRNIFVEFFLEKLYFFMIFVFWANFFSFLLKEFQHECQNRIPHVHRKPWKKITFFEKIVGVLTVFTSERKTFFGFFFSISEIFRLFVDTYFAGPQNCILRLQRNISRIIKFLLKICFFCQVWIFRENCPVFSQKFLLAGIWQL